MSGQEQLQDAYTRHQIVMHRHAQSVAKKVITQTDRLIEKAASLIESSKSGLDQLRYVAIYNELLQINAAAHERIGQELTESRRDLAEFEVKATAHQVEKYTKTPKPLIVPSPEQVIAVANSAPLTGESAVILATVLDNFKASTLKLVDQSVKDGILLGRTNAQIAAEVQALAPMTRRNAQSIAITAVAQVTSESRRAFHKTNADILDSEEFCSVLDSRTTIFCAGHDGKRYPVGTGPRLPAHYRCRSVYVPVVKEAWIRNIPGGGRASVGSDGAEVVSGQTTYQSFLRRQSPEFQNEVLGKTRADLFRSGKLSIDKFSDDSGRVYTLDELRRIYNVVL